MSVLDLIARLEELADWFEETGQVTEQGLILATITMLHSQTRQIEDIKRCECS